MIFFAKLPTSKRSSAETVRFDETFEWHGAIVINIATLPVTLLTLLRISVINQYVGFPVGE